MWRMCFYMCHFLQLKVFLDSFVKINSLSRQFQEWENVICEMEEAVQNKTRDWITLDRWVNVCKWWNKISKILDWYIYYCIYGSFVLWFLINNVVQQKSTMRELRCTWVFCKVCTKSISHWYQLSKIILRPTCSFIIYCHVQATYICSSTIDIYLSGLLAVILVDWKRAWQIEADEYESDC